MHGSETAGSVPKRSRSERRVIGVPSAYALGVKMSTCVSAFFLSTLSEKGLAGAVSAHWNGSFESSFGPMIIIYVREGTRCPLRRKRHRLFSGTHLSYQTHE